MNRSVYFNYIEQKLNQLALSIKTRSKLNILDYNILSENFYSELFNILFNLNLCNINSIKQNSEGIDLIDEKNKVVVQVSSTCTKKKIEDSLNKGIYEQYKDYSFKFISICVEIPSNLKNICFSNPYNLKFDSKSDIWDVSLIIKKILYEKLEKQKEIYEFLKAELDDISNDIKIESNLAYIINILSKKPLVSYEAPEFNSFDIENKITFNNLQDISEIINDYKIYYELLDNIYIECDKLGANKSFSVLQEIRNQYFNIKRNTKSECDIFYEIINEIKNIVSKSLNFEQISLEELELCINIIVVDAFIRCKIFKNPEGYCYATTR